MEKQWLVSRHHLQLWAQCYGEHSWGKWIMRRDPNREQAPHKDPLEKERMIIGQVFHAPVRYAWADFRRCEFSWDWHVLSGPWWHLQNVNVSSSPLSRAPSGPWAWECGLANSVIAHTLSRLPQLITGNLWKNAGISSPLTLGAGHALQAHCNPDKTPYIAAWLINYTSYFVTALKCTV